MTRWTSPCWMKCSTPKPIRPAWTPRPLLPNNINREQQRSNGPTLSLTNPCLLNGNCPSRWLGQLAIIGSADAGGGTLVRHVVHLDMLVDRKSTRLNSSHVAISY